MEVYRQGSLGEAKLEAEVDQMRKENVKLREHIVTLQSEVYGARLAAKYLDKELAGRSVWFVIPEWMTGSTA